MNAKEILEKEFSSGSWVHAYLLISQDTEKTHELINYIISQLQCLQEDITRLVSEETTGKRGEIKIEEIKRFLHEINLTPLGTIRVAIIEGCERLNSSSGNILLKSLEEPAGNIVFVLTSNSDNVLGTIKSRCQILKIPTLLKQFPSDISSIEVLTQSFFQITRFVELLIRDEGEIKFINDLENYFREKLLTEKKSCYGKVIEYIFRAKKDLAANSNARLTLESLILQIQNETK